MAIPIDIKLLREKPELFKESFRKRGLDEKVVDKALELDKKRINLQKEIDSLKHKKNIYSRVIGLASMYLSGKISKEEFINRIISLGFDIHEGTVKEDFVEKLKEEVKELDKKIKEKEKEYKKVYEEFVKLTWNFPNLIHPDVPEGDENFNKPIRYWGILRVKNKEEFLKVVTQNGRYKWKIIEVGEILEKHQKYIIDKELLKDVYLILKGEKEWFEFNYNDVLDFELLNKDKIVPYVLVDYELKHHYDLIKEYNLADTDKAGEVAGSRFYFEFNDLVLLDLGLGIEGIRFLIEKGYKPVIPPYMLKKKVLDGIITLDDFEDMMYKIENEDLYLIGTAEHPITALYYNEIIDEKDLPIKIVGWSPCFRKEAGAHGKDTKGIFRVHQFHKVEQYIFCKPEDSEKYHEELIKNAEEFLQRLNIPYRVVLIASKDMGKRNYKQYDIEGWFPGQQKYRELVSGSNVTDWQARRSNIRYREKNELKYVHTLNCTLTAIQRTLLAYFENHYDRLKDAIYVRELLRKYTGRSLISRP